MSISRVALAVVATAIVGCSTPQIALDQANNGVKLTQGLQTEISRFQSNSRLAAERRLKAIEEVENQAGGIAQTNAFANYLRNKSGMTKELAAQELIRDASDNYAQLIADEEKSRQERGVRLAALVKDLPSPSEKLGAVQKAIAELGAELSPSERLRTVTTFLSEAQAIVEKNAKQADSAASAPVAPASPASGVSN